MTLQELKAEVGAFLKEAPRTWRKGQSIFNYIDTKYHVGRIAQFKYGIDCFYDDSQIDKFMEKSVELINREEINDFYGSNMIEE